tara:strand:- start:966 stop:1145 length:180 start_codon:yes stop_codon:yes gene_type:complete
MMGAYNTLKPFKELFAAGITLRGVNECRHCFVIEGTERLAHALICVPNTGLSFPKELMI